MHHPELGPITVDCDVLSVPAVDLRVVAFTAAPGSEDADKLRLLGRARHPGSRRFGS